MRGRKPLPSGAEKVRAVRSMFDSIAPRYDVVNRVMTFGMDRGWRRRTVDSLHLERGKVVLDLACGTGDLCRELESRGIYVVGIDLSEGMLRAARTNAPLVHGDALKLPMRDASVDGITCGFALRNVTDLYLLFCEMSRVLRTRGRIALLEVAQPESKVLRAAHWVYFNKLVPVIGGLLSDRDAYSYLPRSAAYLPERDEMLRMLRNVGFPDARSTPMPLGAAQLITGTRS